MDRRRLSLRFVACSVLAVLALAPLLAEPAFAGSRDRMTVKRKNTFDQHQRDREAKERREKYEADRKAREKAYAKSKQDSKERRMNGGKTNDEIELQSYGTRTLGGACMYGPKGEVIHRPPGAVCRGEEPPLPRIGPSAEPPQPPAAQKPQPVAPQARPSARPPTAQSRMAPRTDTVLAPNERRSARRERCLWVNGRIAFRPEGVDCYAK